MTINTKTLFSIITLLGVTFSGQAFAASNFQEAWEEEQADVPVHEVNQAPAYFVNIKPWYLQGVTHPYVLDYVDDGMVAKEFDTTPWYFQG